MRALALDMGERRIGVALSDALGITAQRLTVLPHRTPEADAEAVAGLVAEHGVSVVVVGLPLTLKGLHSQQTTRVAAFIDVLRARLTCPVETMDERLTTMQAERTLRETETGHRRRKQLVDQMAAQLILQSYLDGTRQPPAA